MRNKDERRTVLSEAPNPIDAFMFEIGIADRERFIDNQNIRSLRGRDAESQPHDHSARIGAQRHIDVVADFGKRFDLG